MEWIPWTVIIGVLLVAAIAGLSIVISKKRAEARGELPKKEAPAVEGVASAELVETAPPVEVEAVEAEVVEPQIAAPLEETALVEPIAPVVPEIEEPEKAASRLARLRRKLADSNNALARALADLLSSDRIDDETWDDFETTLITSDLGVGPTGELVGALRQQLRIDGIADPEQAKDLLRSELIKLVNPDLDRTLKLEHADGAPAVLLVVGVNGTGKTTTVGKLGRMLVAEDKTVLFGAADTFRAAAAEQLTTWGERVGVETIRSDEGADPASVAFNAVEEGINRGVDVVLVDTAGRLHTKVGLMDELGKVKRVIEKKAPVNEVLLVLDATTGQNGLTQARIFAEVVDVTGIVLTKLDGSAKGGIVVQVQRELGVPVKFIGLGEGADDLAPFDAEQFVDGLLGN
ncbi:signal recognition particle-docking protein FtsY [Brooklawnia propionicigenes]|uniref:Signal recognition particle receptor FtsY n=1 Tax=Brooklawnia propionicigenes TaxID=3041175 RepID=A0AAN0KGH0_9ACTN|nr:signal recognition particle-docking protein FtsY [Brooklawnia sp. SH051]BEH01110.1 signal recognition particle-docking protein FtsY [Brooklawnia sp. SH051]